jgi:hypothetical protein
MVSHVFNKMMKIMRNFDSIKARGEACESRSKGGTMKTVETLIGVLVLVSMITSCTTSTTGVKSDSIAESPPALVMGTKFVYQTKDVDTGKNYIETWVLREIEKYEKEIAYWFDFFLIDSSVSKDKKFTIEETNVLDLNLNYLATFRKGKLFQSASPKETHFSWPLTVGKNWKSTFDYINHERGQVVKNVKTSSKVESYGEVKVPSGIFKVFKINREVIYPNGMSHEGSIYYAPSIGLTVKYEWTLREYKDGPVTRLNVELLEYSLPKK